MSDLFPPDRWAFPRMCHMQPKPECHEAVKKSGFTSPTLTATNVFPISWRVPADNHIGYRQECAKFHGCVCNAFLRRIGLRQRRSPLGKRVDHRDILVKTGFHPEYPILLRNCCIKYDCPGFPTIRSPIQKFPILVKNISCGS